jgi:hypothetical protein
MDEIIAEEASTIGFERELAIHLLEEFVVPGGRLLIASYGEGQEDPNQGILPGSHFTRFILERLEELRLKPVGYRDCYAPYKGSRTRIAILDHESILAKYD